MKKFVGVIIATMALVLCFALSACEVKYASHYSSTFMTTTNTQEEASVTFDSFSGTYVMKLKNTSDEETGLSYNAALKEGSIKVYYDFNDEKLTLLEIGAGGSKEGKTEAFTGNKTIYVIIESDGKCTDGSFSFTLNKAE